MINRIKAVAKKELKQIVRDKRLLAVIFFFPVFLLGIFGYAVNFDVKNIHLAIFDQERSSLSREFINTLTSSEYFVVTEIISSDSQVKDILNEKRAQAVLVIDRDFSKNLFSAKQSKIQVLVDGVDGNTSSIVYNYINVAVFSFNNKIQKRQFEIRGLTPPKGIEAEPVFWFNPDLKSTHFLIPGLISMILIVTAVISVSLTFVREKEKGTIEQINVSSVSSFELIKGKSLPYIIISLINAAFILIAGYLLFDVVVKGSYILLFLTTLVFIVASVSLGIFISVISDSQQVAFSISTFVSLLPSVILSGFVFPIESMPFLVQIITNITPAKFYLVILRSIILKGVGLSAFWDQLIYLSLFIVLFTSLALILSKKKEL
ncbi:MAG: ABC transporter permease [Ignavibacteriaceae bacterium]|jgi:ABC-2 type transport system permease protein|nr:ABC transporter permease [Ignavibacteriaceae bacterium]